MTGSICVSFVGRDVAHKDFSVLTSNSVKTIFAHFVFDSEWDDFPTKTAVFTNGSVIKSQILSADHSCEVPWEVLVESGTLTVGVVGQSGQKIMPSVEVNIPLVKGIYTEGEAPKEPSPDVYQQIVQLMQQTQAIAESVRGDAASGMFNGDDGVSCTHAWNGTVLTVTSASGTSSEDLKGPPGDKGDKPVRGTDYWTDADIAEIKAYVDEAILGGDW